MKKYIFPRNFDYANKLFGIIEYKLLIPLAIFALVFIYLLSFFSLSFFMQFGIFISIFLPLTLLLNISFNHEPSYLFLYSVIKHKFTSQKYVLK